MSKDLNARVRVAGMPCIASIALIAVLASMTFVAPARLTASSRDASASVVVGRYRMQSNAWVNLHQRLLYEASFEEPAPAGL